MPSDPEARFAARVGHLTSVLHERDQVVELLDPPPVGARIALLGHLRLEICYVTDAPGPGLLTRRLVRGCEGSRAKEWPAGTEWRLAAFDDESTGAVRLIAVAAEALASEMARGGSDPVELARALFDRGLITKPDDGVPRSGPEA